MPTQIQTILTAIQKHGMDGFIDIVTDIYANNVRSRLHYVDFYHRTERATLPLIDFDEAIYYSSTFTQEHLDRFTHALNNIGAELVFADKISVIDYGCGQGLATLALLNYLKEHNCIANKVLNIHLIEPSHIALGLARQYILAMAQYCQISVNITVHHQNLSEYLTSPIVSCTQGLNLHLLSNVIDIPAIQADLIALSRHINAQPHKQIICAVSSYGCGFYGFRQSLVNFAVQDEQFSVNSYRFNSNRCVWNDKQANGRLLYAKKVA